jgi:hypothetical protein
MIFLLEYFDLILKKSAFKLSTNSFNENIVNYIHVNNTEKCKRNLFAKNNRI